MDRCLRAVLVVLLLASAGISLGGCEPRFGHVKDAFQKAF